MIDESTALLTETENSTMQGDQKNNREDEEDSELSMYDRANNQRREEPLNERYYLRAYVKD